MEKYNLVMVLNKKETHMLMCLRTKDPYLGLYNLPGGKIDIRESFADIGATISENFKTDQAEFGKSFFKDLK